MEAAPETFLSRQEAARELRCSLDTVDHLIANALLRRYLVSGRYVRVPRSDVEALRGIGADVLRRT